MTTEANTSGHEYKDRKRAYRGASSAPIYGLGFIGALVYYISTATTFWLGVLGFLKAIVWPAMLVYESFKYLNM